MLKNIDGRADIQTLVNKFYQKVTNDDLLSPIFNEVAQVDWDHHLPKMYDFWENILFGTANFSGNPMDKHIQLSRQTPLTQAHFNRWLALFYETVDNHFEGGKASEAKQRAQSIAKLMEHKVNHPTSG